MEDFWPFPSCKDGQILSATDHFPSVTPRTPCTLQRSGVIFLLGYQVFVSKLYHFCWRKVLFLYYALSNTWVFLLHIHRNLNVDHLYFARFPFSSNLLHRNKGKHFCPAWEDLPPKQGLNKPRVRWVDVDTWTIRKILFPGENVRSHNAIAGLRQISSFSRILELHLYLFLPKTRNFISGTVTVSCSFILGLPTVPISHLSRAAKSWFGLE